MKVPRLASWLPLLLGIFWPDPVAGFKIPVEGRLTGPGSRPVQSASVEISPLSDSLRHLGISGETVAVDAAGCFRTTLEPGLWRIVVRAAGFVPAELSLMPLLEAVRLPELRLTPARRLPVRVLDPEGHPVSGAVLHPRIQLARESPSWGLTPGTAVTGESGRVVLELPRRGRFRVSVTARGFAPEEIGIGGPAASPLEVRLRPGATVRIETLDRAGAAVAGVAVATNGLFLGVTGPDGSLDLDLPPDHPMPVRMLAPDGRWAEASLRPAASPVKLRLKLPWRIAGEVFEAPAGATIPGALVWADGDPGSLVRADSRGRFEIEIPFARPEARVRAEAGGYFGASAPAAVASSPPGLRLTLQRSRGIVGRVVDPGGQPIAAARVLLTAWPAVLAGAAPEALPPLELATDPAGSFLAVRVPAGTVGLEISADGFLSTSTGPFEIRPETGPADLGNLTLKPAVRLSGRVTDPQGEPVAGAALFLSRDGMSVGADPLDGAGPVIAMAAADHAGRFTIEEVEPGSLRLTAFAPGYTPGMLAGLDVLPGAGLMGLEIVLGQGALIEGTVTRPSGEPAAGALVTLADNGFPAGLGLPQTTTDAEGGYLLEGVPEGRRTVRAEQPGLLPATGEVKVASGSNRLDLRLRDGAGVSGRAITSAGKPVSEALLRLLPLDEAGPEPPPATSEPDGSFRFAHVADGRYRLQAERPGYAGPPLDVEVRGTTVEGLAVRLDRGGTLTGTIVGLTPGELVRVEVRASSPSGGPDRVESTGADEYRFEDLGAGPWTVVARVAGTARTARGTASLTPEGGTVTLDLVFGSGLTFAGRVDRDGVPVEGAWVTVRKGDETGAALTGEDGSFRIEGLPPGRYTVHVVHPPSGLQRNETLDLDRHLDVSLELAAPLPPPG